MALTQPPRASAELAILLPLEVAAHRLMAIEADLRFLSMKALDCTQHRENAGLTSQIAARLDAINEALDQIRGLVSELETGMRPGRVSPARDD
jgi:hypothetical protein